MADYDLIPHLFRTEYSKLVAVLSKTFGMEHIEVAEDIASDTFLFALHKWPYQGTPANPTAWLYTVAKNKVKNHLIRNRVFKEKVSERIMTDERRWDEIHIDLSDKNIADSQLQMLFTVCHPSISAEAQICLALRILCGFGLEEIAVAFLTNKETIHKRLQRAKEKLRESSIEIEFPDPFQLNERLDTVLHTIYLLFSEGYYSESNNVIVRKELCVEAIQLAYLLLTNKLTNTHQTNALMSLMCFQSSRLEARQSQEGHMILYDEQDQQLWDTELIEKGFYYLQQASQWEVVSKYYMEASIAYWHTVSNANMDKWPSILKLYGALQWVDDSPMAHLNRIYALSKVHGNLAALHEAEKINVPNTHFYFVLLAELFKPIDLSKSKENLQKAIHLCKTDTEKAFLQRKIQNLDVEGE
jgi:RNA polymerase sigma-70 factor (ECF subfamily)